MFSPYFQHITHNCVIYYLFIPLIYMLFYLFYPSTSTHLPSFFLISPPLLPLSQPLLTPSYKFTSPRTFPLPLSFCFSFTILPFILFIFPPYIPLISTTSHTLIQVHIPAYYYHLNYYLYSTHSTHSTILQVE